MKAEAEAEVYRPVHPIRVVTATSLFDGHDAAINIMRRILQATGVEVIHLGHNRSAAEIVDAAVQEDAHAAAVSCYQGGHLEFFKYIVDLLRQQGCGHVKVFGGGGGVIVPEEIRELEAYGVAKIYSPEDGARLGLQGMINHLVRSIDYPLVPDEPDLDLGGLTPQNKRQIARVISFVETAKSREFLDALPSTGGAAGTSPGRSAGQPDSGAGPQDRALARFRDELKKKLASAGAAKPPAPGDSWAGNSDAAARAAPRGLQGRGDGAATKPALEDLGGRGAHVAPPPLAESALRRTPVVGITGTGGSGKSSLTDELVLRFLLDFKDATVAVLSVDPSRRKTGGALLGDRIRMNAIGNPRVYMRSLATRGARTELSGAMAEAIQVVQAAGFDLVIAETAGIGQGDTAIVDLVDVSLYVMTPEFGSSSQLEKIDMLDFADLVCINKFEKRGGDDAVRDVRKQVQRNRKVFSVKPEEMPVFGTIASRFNDDGVTALYHALLERIGEKTGREFASHLPRPQSRISGSRAIIIPPERTRYLSEISHTVRAYHRRTAEQAEAARRAWHLKEAARALAEAGEGGVREAAARLREAAARAEAEMEEETKRLLEEWPRTRNAYGGDDFVYRVRDREIRVPLHSVSLAHQRIPKVVLPRFEDPGEIYRWLREENLPGHFPYTAGVFPFKRTGEDPTRMFAGEGDPARTNRRFKLLSAHSEAKRLSTAFDSVTLYGYDPDERPDIYGKVGTSGVSVCTLDDVKVLYGGFDLAAANNSVSMTINGPAPIMLAMFLNTAIDQRVEAWAAAQGRPPADEEARRIRAEVLETVRGTVQADILKEDQGQNTCIFSIDFALKMMGDIQQYFIDHNVRNFYSVSISGYHIAEAGANPISQLAFTLANGFTYVEYYLSRGMPIDSFAPNLSFFFSNGMDPEYTVIGRVARRIWAIAMREIYRGCDRSQMLKYHVQTSGRSLHSQEIQFNDARTTLQALCAVYDNCQSLHTNAFDEAITTPTEDSVRRALAIQLIINREWGLAKNENTYQGSFIVEELTRLVEEAVLAEFDQLTLRGGVLGAMETGYQRSKIQEESIHYETLKHTGELPVIGVNTFRNPHAGDDLLQVPIELARATEEEKVSQLRRVRDFMQRHEREAPQALEKLQRVALAGGNLFAELMDTVRVASLGQITRALYEVGGQYRRSM